MNFSQADYSLTCEGDKVVLLRKEFFLLSFLHKNHGRAFSREEILDAVWPLEEPTDRTVDDHIYRLRKKLAPFKGVVSIKTVKGFGYRLEVKEKKQCAPDQIPEELFQQANQLFNMYYKYGQGKALKALMTNQDLGFPLKEKHESVLLLLKSDFTSLLNKGGRAMNNKFFPLHLFGYVENDTKRVISMYEKVINMQVLREEEHMDLAYFSLPMLYLKVDQANAAMKLVKQGLEEIQSADHGFYPLLKIMKTIVLFYENKLVAVNGELVAIDQLLKLRPYLREQGALQVLKGLALLAGGEKIKGRDAINEGILIINQSGHSYYFLFIYQVLDFLLSKAGADKRMIRYYQSEKGKYYKTTNLLNLKAVIHQHIRTFL
ncbi:winged helix-turn-helix domain-containing protein [Alteribacter populi]|uniref:winged helix-turn-helix domain-containing protein n=1 Tax=Alteribacter populi TaxID=2011011 RepID=UPI000BBB1298|nr:winged helix-turn-helix domain-containing protein [Alteribacter populi]